MAALWVVLAVAICGYALNWFSAAPAARGVSASVRLAEARRIVTHDEEPPARVLELVR